MTHFPTSNEGCNSPNYHPPTAKWNEEFSGHTWKDMCGADNVDKKLNFFLFRRGLYDPLVDCVNDPLCH